MNLLPWEVKHDPLSLPAESESLRQYVVLESQGFLHPGHCCPLSILILVELHVLLPAAATLCYAFLTIRMDDTTIMDFLRYAARYFITTQQYYEWR